MAHNKEVNTQLKNLPLGEHRLIDIVKIVASCTQYQQEGLFNNSPYGIKNKKPFDDTFYEEYIVKQMKKFMPKGLEDVYVDITYQRVLKLKALINHLKRLDMHRTNKLNFSKMLAGSLDIVVRPNGRCMLWDGFRRSLIALLNGIRYVNCSIVLHDGSLSTIECRAIEAFNFKIKNGTAENMPKEELFKSGIVYEEPESMKLFKLIKEMNVDVLGTNYGHPELGAFSEFKDTVEKKKLSNDDFLVEASFKIQNAWPNDAALTGYFLCGLAKFLDAIQTTDDDGNVVLSFGEDIYTSYPNLQNQCEVENALVQYAINKKQTTLCANRLAGKAIESIAMNIGRKVMKLDKSQQYELAEVLGFDVEESDTLNFMDLAGASSVRAFTK